MTIRRSAFLDRMLFCPEGKIQRSTQLWHSVFSVLNAMQSALLLLIVTRVCGEEKAGIFSLAFSIAYLMIMIGNYGVRNYQATDVALHFGFQEYRKHRRITCILMMAVSIGYILISGYEKEKALTVLLCCVLKLTESIENLYHGEYQRANRLDVAGKTATIRLGLCILTFVTVLLLTHDMVLSFAFMDLTSAIVLILLLIYTYPKVHISKAKKPTDWKQIFLVCLPLFLCSFFYIYICNASKYALDRFADEATQGYYGMIFMPVFSINLISNCIYGPFLVRLAGYWKNNEIKPLSRFVKLQIIAVLLISAVVTALAYLLGTQVLSIVYGRDLTRYKWPLAILLLGGGVTALVDFTNNILTVIRKQKILVYIYSAFAAVAFLCTELIVKNNGITGAAVSYTLVLALQAGTMIAAVMITLKKGNQSRELTEGDKTKAVEENS